MARKRVRTTPGKTRGRPKGVKDSTSSPERRAASLANAAQPRIRMDEEVRERLKAAKNILARALSDEGTVWLLQIIREGPPHWEYDAETRERRLVDGSAQFEWAMNFAADRAGMPRRSEQDITGPPSLVIRVEDERSALGWPSMGEDAGDGRVDRGDAGPVN